VKRRDFFKLGMQKATDIAVEEAEARVVEKARQWIRPPFALHELDFLLKCTRCGDCTEACPHGVIFPLPAKFGIEAVSTPAMDLTVKGCRLCDDWPCVRACEPEALLRAEVNDGPAGSETNNPKASTNIELPKLAQVTIIEDRCLPFMGPECGACAHSCPVEGALLWDGPKPRINNEACTGCAMCREACITEPKSIGVRSVVSASRIKAI